MLWPAAAGWFFRPRIRSGPIDKGLSEAERLRMLEVLERIRDSPPSRPQEEVEAELREIREARKRAWRSKT